MRIIRDTVSPLIQGRGIPFHGSLSDLCWPLLRRWHWAGSGRESWYWRSCLL